VASLSLHFGPTAYREWAAQQLLPLFHQAWWLDTQAPNTGWDARLVVDGSGTVLGAWPFFTQQKRGLTLQLPPHWQPRSGPLLAPEYARTEATPSQVRKVHQALLEGLPPAADALWSGYPLELEATAFKEQGWHLNLRYTYQIDLTLGTEALLHNASKYFRKKLKNAPAVLLEPGLEPAVFWKLIEENWHRQGLNVR
jgi:hypothetical protein